MIRALLIVSITLLVSLPVLAQRGAVHGGGGGMHGLGGGMHGALGGMHPGFGGSIRRGFNQLFHNNFRFRNFDRSLSRFTFGSPGFDGSDADYGNPFDYGYPSDDSQRYDSSNAGHQSSVSAVIAVQLTPHIYSYVPLDSRNAPVAPDIHEYVPPPSQTDPYVSTLYLIAFQDNSIRAALAYWAESSTLRYVTMEHEQKQAPLASVDRALSERLNGERHVLFRLPSR